mmetsp:Transcript_85061/g.219124  ORF Transcript_85061/g.219124 Transcript_85061/m.219124 type:complete len:288 (+) Transcript_85061:52-915(+)
MPSLLQGLFGINASEEDGVGLWQQGEDVLTFGWWHRGWLGLYRPKLPPELQGEHPDAFRGRVLPGAARRCAAMDLSELLQQPQGLCERLSSAPVVKQLIGDCKCLEQPPCVHLFTLDGAREHAHHCLGVLGALPVQTLADRGQRREVHAPLVRQRVGQQAFGSVGPWAAFGSVGGACVLVRAVVLLPLGPRFHCSFCALHGREAPCGELLNVRQGLAQRLRTRLQLLSGCQRVWKLHPGRGRRAKRSASLQSGNSSVFAVAGRCLSTCGGTGQRALAAKYRLGAAVV